MSTSGRLAALRAAAPGPDPQVARWDEWPAAHRVANMTTNSLVHHRVTLADGSSVTLFSKTLHPASCSPIWSEIPEFARAEVLRDLHWLDEPRLYRCGLDRDLPAGLRFPRLFHVEEDADRLTLWLEAVDDTTGWDLGRYRRTAAALGALHARWPEQRAVEEAGLGRRDLGPLLFGKVAHVDLVIQADDGFWQRPEIRDAVDDRHRADLEWLASAAPELLEASSALPHGAAHGDATPDNFREPGDGTIVALDWSYGSVAPPGADLGQLLVGRFESGAEEAHRVSDIAEVVIGSFVEGASADGLRLDPADVALGLATHFAIRSIFSALVVDHRPDLDDAARADLVGRRAAVARFGLDLCAAALARSGADDRARRSTG